MQVTRSETEQKQMWNTCMYNVQLMVPMDCFVKFFFSSPNFQFRFLLAVRENIRREQQTRFGCWMWLGCWCYFFLSQNIHSYWNSFSSTYFLFRKVNRCTTWHYNSTFKKKYFCNNNKFSSIIYIIIFKLATKTKQHLWQWHFCCWAPVPVLKKW